MGQSLSEWFIGDRPAIQATGLVKRFGSVTALDGLDLEVGHQEAVSYTHLTLPTILLV